ncbi:MAG: tetratricopeptide repeat protein [Rhizomicrobium sp.]
MIGSMMRSMFRLAALGLAFGVICSAAQAQSIDMGNCTDDQSVPPERIVVACKNFIGDRMIENWRTEYIPNAIYYRGLAYQRLGKSKDAQADFLELMRHLPSFAGSWVHYGEIAEQTGAPGGMMKILDIMIASNQTDPEILETACWERGKRGQQMDAALADCNESLRLKPKVAATLDTRGFVYFRRANFPAAIADCNAALALDPKLASSFYVRGLAKKASGDNAGSEADIASAKALDPKVADTYATYGVRP